jgi:hypothetical protein
MTVLAVETGHAVAADGLELIKNADIDPLE